jgi:hypothetical protein
MDGTWEWRLEIRDWRLWIREIRSAFEITNCDLKGRVAEPYGDGL